MREKAVLDLDEEAKGDAPAEGLRGDDEVDQAAGGGRIGGGGVFGRRRGHVVDVVVAMGVGEFLGLRVGDFGEDEGGQRRRVACCAGGVLC